MPELPDIEAISTVLNRRVVDITIQQVKVLIPIVVRADKEEFFNILAGNTFRHFHRRGKFLLGDLSSGHCLVMHLMLTGRLQYCPSATRRRAKTCFILVLADGQDLRYYDERLMGKVYLVEEGQLDQVPRLAELGPEPLSQELTEELFVQHLRRFSGQVKSILMNESLVAGIGNAYADEILYAAGIHPFRRRTDLSVAEASSLYRAIRSVLTEAIPLVQERMGDDIDQEPRDFLKVHRRGGQPCPGCGMPITEITANQRITSFCRNCQK